MIGKYAALWRRPGGGLDRINRMDRMGFGEGGVNGRFKFNWKRGVV
jgi:hypothetical protein